MRRRLLHDELGDRRGGRRALARVQRRGGLRRRAAGRGAAGRGGGGHRATEAGRPARLMPALLAGPALSCLSLCV